MKSNTLPLTRYLSQSQDTQKLGAVVGSLCPAQCVIFLKGPLGSGKTTFARGLIQNLSDSTRVKSPTYTLVETYQVSEKFILHFDLYRLQSPLELEAIGVRDYTQDAAIWLVEWPERAMQENQPLVLPEPDLVLSFVLLDEGHKVVMTEHSSVGEKLLHMLPLNY